MATVPPPADDAFGGGLRHPRRSPDRDQTQPLQIHARPSLLSVRWCLASWCRRGGTTRRDGPRAVRRARRWPRSTPGCMASRPSGSGCWLTWQRSASILRSNVSVMSTKTSAAPAVTMPDLADRPRLEALVEQLGMGERVAGIGVDRRHRRLAGGEVVGVAGVDAVRSCARATGPTTRCGRTWRITRLMSRRRSKRRLEAAVGISEEGDVGDADDLRRGALLGFADLRHLGRGTCGRSRPASPLVHDAVRDLDAGVGPAGDGPRVPEVDVVGMRGDDQDPFDVSRRRASSEASASQLTAGPSPRAG